MGKFIRILVLTHLPQLPLRRLLLRSQLLHLQLQALLRGARGVERRPLRLHLQLQALRLQPQAVPVPLRALQF